jgi:diadenosine tetraphosphate (Ap4A) HIT family hydrolase
VSREPCPLCDIVVGLERGEVYRPAGGPGAYRKIADLPTAVAVLGDDQFYRGYSMVIARGHATELYHLPEPDALAYVRDMLRVARAIDAAFRPRKMNYELLGNTVAHLHWHLFPRYAGDPNPQRPVWEQAHQPPVLTDADYAATIAAIRARLDR